MKQITINAEYLFEFSSMNHWVNKGRSWFTPYRGMSHVCIDSENNVLTCGEDFRIAEERGTYPVKVYLMQRVADPQLAIAKNENKEG